MFQIDSSQFSDLRIGFGELLKEGVEETEEVCISVYIRRSE